MASGSYQALILHDGVTGHLRQCQAAAQILKEQLKLVQADLEILELPIPVKYRPSWIQKIIFYLTHPLAKHCPSCSRCVRYSLPKDDWQRLLSLNPDVVFSAFGKRVSDINYWLSRHTGSRSIILMKPKNGVDRFDLVIVPRHDQAAEEGPVIVTEGAPNLMSREEIILRSSALRNELPGLRPFVIGVLMGGDYKKFHMDEQVVEALIQNLKEASETLNADLLLTTSRRTPKRVERILESHLSCFSRTQLLIIANKENKNGVVAGILGLSQVAVISPESVSMISEAASSGAHVLVFHQKNFLSEKHQAFLTHLNAEGYIRLIQPDHLASELSTFVQTRQHTRPLKDAPTICRALQEKIIPALLQKSLLSAR